MFLDFKCIDVFFFYKYIAEKCWVVTRAVFSLNWSAKYPNTTLDEYDYRQQTIERVKKKKKKRKTNLPE